MLLRHITINISLSGLVNSIVSSYYRSIALVFGTPSLAIISSNSMLVTSRCSWTFFDPIFGDGVIILIGVHGEKRGLGIPYPRETSGKKANCGLSAA